MKHVEEKLYSARRKKKVMSALVFGKEFGQILFLSLYYAGQILYI